MSWLDVFTPAPGIRPACPASENFAGRHESVDAVALSSTSSMSSTEKSNEKTFPDSLLDDPTAAQLDHARRMLVDCPSTDGKLHCWYCSRCDDARTCTAWRALRQDVEFFRKSGEPYSLFLVESGAVEVVQ